MLAALIIAAIITPIGAVVFGVTILSGSIVGVLIVYFIPAVLVLAGVLVLVGIVPTGPPMYRIIIFVALLLAAWAFWSWGL
jgi:hypothetical protein